MTDSKHSPGVLDPEWEDALRRGQEAEGEAGSVDAELAFVHLLRHSREPEAIAPEQLDAIWSAIEAEVAPARAPWWRKAWVWWSAPALAAAAVLVVVIIKPDASDEATLARQDQALADKHEDKRESAAPAPGSARDLADEGFEGAAQAVPAEAELEPADKAAEETIADHDGARGSSGAAGGKPSSFEVSYTKLAPHGRLAIRVGVEYSRDELRSQLISTARGGAG